MLAPRAWYGFISVLDLRLFLFHTTLGSGAAAGFLPLMEEENFGALSLVPLPVLATSRGREAVNAAAPGGGVLEPDRGFSLVFELALAAFPLAARKVLFTETALNVVGFLTEDPVRP